MRCAKIYSGSTLLSISIWRNCLPKLEFGEWRERKWRKDWKSIQKHFDLSLNLTLFLFVYKSIRWPKILNPMEYEILNYEQEILTNSQIRQLERPQDPSLFTFREWELSNIISSVMNLPRSEISLRWVGNSLYSITLSFFYSAFRLCILRPEFILYLKHNVYRIGQYYLSLAEQKSLAHFLSSLSEGIDVADFLCENRNI